MKTTLLIAENISSKQTIETNFLNNYISDISTCDLNVLSTFWHHQYQLSLVKEHNFKTFNFCYANWLENKLQAGRVRNQNLIDNSDFVLIVGNSNMEYFKHFVKLIEENNIPYKHVNIESDAAIEITKNNNLAEDYDQLKNELIALKDRKINVMKNQQYELAASLRDQERSLLEKMEGLFVY